MAADAPIPSITYKKTFLPSPGGGSARGPCGPKAIQYATVYVVSGRNMTFKVARMVSSCNDAFRSDCNRYDDSQSCPHTSLLLLHRQLIPVNLHAIPQLHPQVGLLLRWHGLPSLLNVCESWVADGMGLSPLCDLLGQWCDLGSSGTESGRGEAGTSEDGGAQHLGRRNGAERFSIRFQDGM